MCGRHPAHMSSDGHAVRDPAQRSRMRVRPHRFLRWATPLPSREQMAVFLRAALVQIKMRRPQEQAREIKQKRFARDKLLTFGSNNVGVEKARKHFPYQWLTDDGALGGTRTPTILLTATSRQRVYQFRHERFGYRLDRLRPAGSTAPMEQIRYR